MEKEIYIDNSVSKEELARTAKKIKAKVEAKEFPAMPNEYIHPGPIVDVKYTYPPKTEVNVTTLEDICKKLIEYKLYDLKMPLQVCYRKIGPDLQDRLFGYCIVGKKMSGFTFINEEDAGSNYVESDDVDSYLMSDEIVLWQFQKERGVEGPILHVWIPTDWTTE